jgi:hypothetical protein
MQKAGKWSKLQKNRRLLLPRHPLVPTQVIQVCFFWFVLCAKVTWPNIFFNYRCFFLEFYLFYVPIKNKLDYVCHLHLHGKKLCKKRKKKNIGIFASQIN